MLWQIKLTDCFREIEPAKHAVDHADVNFSAKEFFPSQPY